MKKTIETHMSRKFTVENSSVGSVHLTATNVGSGAEIVSSMSRHTAVDLGTSIFEAADKKVFTYDGSLPGVGTDNGYLVSGQGNSFTERSINDKPEDIVGQIKALIAIHNTLLRREAEAKSEATLKRAAEEALKARRDALVNRFAGTVTRSYSGATEILRESIDYAIELEDKLKLEKKFPPGA